MDARALQIALMLWAVAALGCARKSGPREGEAGSAGSSSTLSRLPGTRASAVAAAGRLSATTTVGVGGGDAGWRDTTWDPDCPDLQVATQPEFAVPVLEWRACEGVSGCERLVPNWSSNISGSRVPFLDASVYKQNGVLRLSIHMWFDEEWRKAVYQDARTPLAAWRGGVGTGQCGGVYVGTNQTGACLLMGKGLELTRFVVLPLDNVTREPLHSFDSNAIASEGCTDAIFTGVAGGRYSAMDLANGNELLVGPPSGEIIDFVPFADMVFFTRSDSAGGRAILDGWLWTREGARQLVVPASDNMIYDLRGDGSVLAWLEMPYTTDFQDHQAGTLWTSPFVATEAGVARRRVRDVPLATVASRYKMLNDGHYALVEQPNDSSARLLGHVYRLSDNRHWEVPPVGDLQAGPLLHLDRDELWYVGLSPGDVRETIIRQRLSALGEGD